MTVEKVGVSLQAAWIHVVIICSCLDINPSLRLCVCAPVCVPISHGPHDRGIRGSVAFPSCAFHTVTTHTIHKTPWLHPAQRHKGGRREMGQIVSGEHVCLICGLWHIPFNWHSCFFSVLLRSCFLLGKRLGWGQASGRDGLDQGIEMSLQEWQVLNA